MKPEKLYESIGAIDEEILERSEKHKEKKRRRGPKWAAAAAVVLAGALAGGILLQPGSGSQVLASCALEEASYPEMADYPNEEDYINKITGSFDEDKFSKVYNAWRESVDAQKQEEGYADGLETFFIASIREFLSGKEGNRVYSPLNVYMALSMLAELTDGDSRQQILDLLGTEDMETLRNQAKAIWNAQYRDDGATTSILASSLWLDQDVDYNSSVLDLLTENYYTSSYQGEMGSSRFSQAYQDWINEQTRGLLEEQSKELKLKEEDILALAATVCFQAKWSEEFNENNTSSQTFHGTSQDITCDFMHSRNQGTYYWGQQFGAVGRSLDNGGGTMWFLLPDEGVSPEELLEDPQVTEFLVNRDTWENSKYLTVNLALPKFDITSQMDLKEGLKNLGITQVFDETAADFSALVPDMEKLFVSQIQHDVRVAIDEEGVTAAAYTAMSASDAAMPPEDEVDFVLDRPFLFVLTNEDGLPLFAGIVEQP